MHEGERRCRCVQFSLGLGKRHAGDGRGLFRLRTLRGFGFLRGRRCLFRLSFRGVFVRSPGLIFTFRRGSLFWGAFGSVGLRCLRRGVSEIGGALFSAFRRGLRFFFRGNFRNHGKRFLFVGSGNGHAATLQHHRHASREKRIRHGGKRACRIKTVIAVRALHGRAVRRFLVRHQPDRTAVGTTCYVSHSQTRERKRPRKKLSGFLIRTALKSSRVFRQDKSTRSFLYKG